MNQVTPPVTFGPIDHRRLLAMAIPIVLANLTQPILSTVDIGIAGHLGTGAALGGVALGGLWSFFSADQVDSSMPRPVRRLSTLQ